MTEINLLRIGNNKYVLRLMHGMQCEIFYLEGTKRHSSCGMLNARETNNLINNLSFSGRVLPTLCAAAAECNRVQLTIEGFFLAEE